jgi:hypothetical protein
LLALFWAKHRGDVLATTTTNTLPADSGVNMLPPATKSQPQDVPKGESGTTAPAGAPSSPPPTSAAPAAAPPAAPATTPDAPPSDPAAPAGTSETVPADAPK